MQHAITIELFGGLRVRCGTQIIDRFRSQKTAALLAYLACHGRMHAREKLAEILWPDSSPQAARASLCVALSSLRAQLEPPGVATGSVLRADRSTIGLPSSVAIDLRAVTDLLDRADYLALQPDQKEKVALLRRQAVALFRGDLLTGMYEPWVASVQDALHTRVAEALIYLATLSRDRGEVATAYTYIQQALTINPSCPLPATLQSLTETSFVQESKGKYVTATDGSHSSKKKDSTSRKIRRRLDVPSRRKLSTTIVATAAAGAGPIIPTAPRLFGRRTEFAQIRALLSDRDTRLVTLTGLGGIGKTRLAQAVLENIESIRSDWQTVFVSAAGLHDFHSLPELLAEAWGLSRPAKGPAPKEVPGGGIGSSLSTFEQIVSHLNGEARPILLVLDNFETVIEGGDRFVESLLAAVPWLTCLITSRSPLQRMGECEVPIGPLPVPPVESLDSKTTIDGETEQLDVLLENWPSVAFFVHRAQLSVPDFRISSHNVSSIKALVTRLEGIPLAIELAAARSQTYTPQQMLEQVEKRFDFLVHRQRMLRSSDRHASLRATLAWSYDELQPQCRSLLRCLSVFRGGCRVEAISAVALSSRADELEADLDSLCGSSLLTRDTDTIDSGTTRFTLLDTVREFVEGEIDSEEQSCLLARHATFFVQMAEMAEPHLKTNQSAIWLEYIDQEQKNIYAALNWACSTQTAGAAESALRLASSLHRYWLVRGQVRQGREWLRIALAHPSGGLWEPAREAVARNSAGILASTAGDAVEAEQHYNATLSIRRASGERRGVATTLNNLAVLASEQGRYSEAYAWYEESLALWRELDETRNIGIILANLGAIANDMGRLDEAMAYLSESIPLARAAKNTRGAAISLRNCGEVAYKKGDMETAEALFLESLGIFDSLGDIYSAAYSLFGVGAIAWHRRQERRARRLLLAAIQAFAAFGIPLPAFCRGEVNHAHADGLTLYLDSVSAPSRSSSQQVNSVATSEALQAIKVLTQVVLDAWEEPRASPSGAEDAVGLGRSFVPMFPAVKG